MPDDNLEKPDVEIGASVRAKRMRFKHRPNTHVEVHGEAHTDERLARAMDDERVEVETASGSERENLPDEVEPGTTYRDVRVQWRAAAKIKGRDGPARRRRVDDDGEEPL